MSDISAITLYAANDSVAAFDDLVDPTKILTANMVDFEGVDEDGRDWSARLYLWPGVARPPSWLAFLQDGFGDNLTVPDTAQSRALVAINVFFRKERFFVMTFGAGRFQLRRGATDSSWALRTALNSIYADADSNDRVRQVETRTVAANTFRTLRQANRGADFDAFGHDTEADQLSSIVGKLADESALGSQIKGGGSLRIMRRSTFVEVGKLCRLLASAHEKKDYQRRFGFVDDIRPITSSSQVDALTDGILQDIEGNPGQWRFAPPGLIDFDRVTDYRVQLPGVESFATSEPTIDEILSALADEGLELTRDILARGEIQGRDDSGDVVGSWSLQQVLDGEIEHDGETYLLEGGEFFVIEPDYLEALDKFMDGIAASGVALPDSARVMKNGKLKEIDEGAYNTQAADSSDDYLLLDKETVTIPGKTSPVEICDVLSVQGALVHVKRKLSSSSLSHLFSQGYVSSELMVDSLEFRKAVRKKIGSSNAAFRALFSDDLAANDFEVVFAIVAEWGARQVRDMPFFSKVNLRKTCRALRRLGFKVTHAKVQVVDP